MTAIVETESTAHNTPGSPEVLFGRSVEGFLAARVGDSAFGMLPRAGGGHYLATGWRLTRPIEEWTRFDFFGHSGEIRDEANFRVKVEENAQHQRERRALGRREVRSTANTPWGVSQGVTVYAEGVVCHSTAGHGGFHLSAERNSRVYAMLRSEGGWYEEDAAWAIVALTFPHLFTTFERRCADRTVRDAWPDAWETIFGRRLAPGESHEKDRRTFERDHAGDWIVICAITCDREKGFVEVVATLGGSRGAAEQRRYLVPVAEYQVGRFGFVIDETRHCLYGGPSSFIGWQAGRAL